MLFTYGSGSPLRNEGSAVVAVGAVVVGVAFGGVVWFCILVVTGTRVVTGVEGVCCVCIISGSVAFFCSEILGWDVVGGDDGAWCGTSCYQHNNAECTYYHQKTFLH